MFCGNGKYHVTGQGMDQYAVDMGHQTYSCNRWELTCMTCKHVIVAIWDMGLNNEDIGILET